MHTDHPPAPGSSAAAKPADHYLYRELREQVERSPEILEFIRCAALDGLWYWDLRQPANEWMDDRFWKLLGYDPSQMPHLASAWQGLIHPDDLQCALANFERHVADPSHAYDQIVRYRHANGSTVWVRCRGLVLRDADNKPYRMIGAHVDVTELAIAKQELERTNSDLAERIRLRTSELANVQDRLAHTELTNQRARESDLRQLIEGLPLLVWTCTPEGPCDYLSAQWVAYTGIPEAEQLGTGWTAQLHPDDLPNIQAAWGTSVASGKPLDTEFRIRRYDGEYRWFQTRALPMHGADGAVEKWFGTNTDIHDRKMLEQALRERTNALETSNGELEQFAYIASHDLQEPLRTITSYVQLIERRYAQRLDDRGRQYMTHVVSGARKMRSLIVDLLDYSRATMAPVEESSADAHAALSSAQAALETLIAESGAKISSAALPVVAMDAGSLVRVFQNLLSNAIHYSAGRRPEIHVDCVIEGGWATLSVQDNGIGIAPEYQRRIFQMFQRLHTHLEKPGTGVGLALCRRLVARANGEIWVKSEPGAGATFYVRLRHVNARTSAND